MNNFNIRNVIQHFVTLHNEDLASKLHFADCLDLDFCNELLRLEGFRHQLGSEITRPVTGVDSVVV